MNRIRKAKQAIRDIERKHSIRLLPQRRAFNCILRAGGCQHNKGERIAYIVWGPPGCGKSSLSHDANYQCPTLFKNIDDIVKQNCKPEPTSEEEYWKCRKKKEILLIDKYLDHLAKTQKLNLAIETTGNQYDPSWARNLLKEGFTKVVIYVVYVNDLNTLWERVQRRNQLSVQNKEALKEIYQLSYNTNLKIILKDDVLDEVVVFDNSVHVKVGSPPLKIASTRDGAIWDNVVPKSTSFVLTFLEWAGLSPHKPTKKNNI
jgi:shikimate kinase